MRNSGWAAAIGVALVCAIPSRPAQATEISLDLRQTLLQAKSTPESVIFPTLTLGVTVSEHIAVGAGYEVFQNHDATFWDSAHSGMRPISLSAIRVGCWYRDGEIRHGLTLAIGPIISYANSAISRDTSPSYIDGFGSDSYFINTGVDMSIGYVGRRGRVELFMTPSWVYGRVVSPAVGRSENHSGIEARIGVSFALLLGTPS
jgi:hypothetical protein